MKILKQINQKFKINENRVECRKCGSDKVTVFFCKGFIHSCGGDIGALEFECPDCNEKLEVDED